MVALPEIPPDSEVTQGSAPGTQERQPEKLPQANSSVASHWPAAPLHGGPSESEDGETFWMTKEYKRSDWGMRHGIEAEEVPIPNPPKTAEEVEKFLPGTIWGWGISPSGDREWIMFLDDGTMYGSWGYRYRYEVDPETLSVAWAEHRLSFTDKFRYLQNDGSYPRMGMLVKKVEGAEFEKTLKDAEGMGIIEPDENSVPDQQ